ncbi:HAD family hydrolase [Pseudoalteromonas xiamenensis]|uniref:HAD family hydrolase n=1 Tax=Pseudoalteromonas xiamenensis TaxID=882626 RepID=A0A975DH03_9GAMM|nr:HAD family hydrolase [Pseudoalteromonas xiamenensis]QTH71045.1 HAD family hydrolase [Pseudoalteromonas xiamenensis]
MKIGIDFDNTIVDYTGVFYTVAMDLGWLPEGVGNSKKAVKDYFINSQQEARWTELQGLVYGKFIFLAKPYSHCLSVLQDLKSRNVQLYLISHKTKYPFIGEKTDLHLSAMNWLQKNGFIGTTQAPFLLEHVYFNEKKEDKINLIGELGCEVFLDDLPEILTHTRFPQRCAGILFSPELTDEQSDSVTSWSEFNERYA